MPAWGRGRVDRWSGRPLLVAVVLSLIGAFYYLRIIKVMYFDAPVAGVPAIEARSQGISAMLALNGGAVIVLGLLPGGLMALCRDAILRALAS